jgi:hypothetical protein
MTTTATDTNDNPAMTLAMAGRGLETNGVSSPRVFFLFFFGTFFFSTFFSNLLIITCSGGYLERHR